jgi:hypothetical protein
MLSQELPPNVISTALRPLRHAAGWERPVQPIPTPARWSVRGAGGESFRRFPALLAQWRLRLGIGPGYDVRP